MHCILTYVHKNNSSFIIPMLVLGCPLVYYWVIPPFSGVGVECTSGGGKGLSAWATLWWLGAPFGCPLGIHWIDATVCVNG